jgi:hypothetical protein
MCALPGEVRILVARSKPTCWDYPLVRREHDIGARDSESLLRFCHQEESDSVHFSSEMKMKSADQQNNLE